MTNSTPWTTWVPALMTWLAMVVTVISGLIVRNQTIKTKKMETESSPYAALASRVTHLENQNAEQARKIREMEDVQDEDRDTIVALTKEINQLKTEQHEDRAWIHAMVAWVRLQYPDADGYPKPPSWFDRV